eukprot:2601078-Pyramimonas_sp.AAC.1
MVMRRTRRTPGRSPSSTGCNAGAMANPSREEAREYRMAFCLSRHRAWVGGQRPHGCWLGYRG